MTLDVFADIACPWCYIGEAHLSTALAQRPHLAVNLAWRPFQLQPGLPPEGRGRDFFVHKFGGEAAMAAAFAHVEQAGARAGLQFDFDALHGAPNTMDAHRLILLGNEYGRAWETAGALFQAYFAEGRNLNDPETLLAVAQQAGVPGAEVEALLGDDRYREDVKQSQALAAHLGIQGVPFVVVDGRYGVSGAQPPEAILEVLDRASDEAVPSSGAPERGE